ncbi:helix-turn-helix domain-containing protein [Reinekea sp.]|jgi:DNA-binding Xre family transcriptional regulator|uniref:helix-turn-helix domain-containing protein n=1 Tax=Reinekea sp. TaxID=1970455 RepID=UPI002A80BC75|nr:helix-turn-helix domain-containing protein [Reinekea sp.]
MSQTAQLIDTLKRILRERKITYADVATHLSLSEANVKRMFSKRHFTLNRLEEVCALAHADLGYLMARMHEGSMIIAELTLLAEKELIDNVKLLMMAQLLINRWELADIVTTYTFDEHEVTRLLAKLDRLGIIELLPGNRVRNLVSRDFKWLHNGPVHKYFEQHVAREFFNCTFNPKSGELLVFMAGMLTRQSNSHMQNSIRRLAREFDELCKEDGKLPISETYGSGLVLALRPWELSVFTEYRRVPNSKKF